MDPTGCARLSDIGFSRPIPTGESGLNWTDAGADGCRWTAPEVFQGGEPSKQSDVFTYGFVSAEVRPHNRRFTAVADLAKILTGNFVWEGITTAEVRSKILGNERPRRPEGGKECTLTTDLWRMFESCWKKEPGGRISIPRVLNLLQYL